MGLNDLLKLGGPMKKNKIISLLCAGCMIGAGGILSACNSGGFEISSISVTTLPKTEYIVGSYINLTGGKLTAVCDNGKKLELELGLAAVDVGKLDSVGEQTVTVMYANKKSSFKVLVRKAQYDIVIQDIITTYNGEEQPIDVAKLSEQVILAEGMEIGDITYRRAGGSVFTDDVPKNSGNYEIKVHINGGNKYEDSDVIANYIIGKADFNNYKNDNVFQYAKNVYAEYGTAFNVKNLWLNNANRSESFNYDLNADWGINCPFGEISLSDDDIAEDGLIFEYEIFKEEASRPGAFSEKVFDVNSTDQTQLTDEQIVQAMQSLPVGNYIIKTTCQSESQNFNVYSQTSNLSIKKRQLVLTEDFDVKVSYQGSSGAVGPISLNLSESSADFAGIFDNFVSDFEIIVESKNDLISNSAFSYSLEYGESFGEGIALNINNTVPCVDKAGVYVLRLHIDSNNFEFCGMISFMVNGD